MIASSLIAYFEWLLHFSILQQPFGPKCDQLPDLVNKISNDADADPVHQINISCCLGNVKTKDQMNTTSVQWFNVTLHVFATDKV